MYNGFQGAYTALLRAMCIHTRIEEVDAEPWNYLWRRANAQQYSTSLMCIDF